MLDADGADEPRACTGSGANEAMAIELPNGSWIQRTAAAGSIVRLVCSRRRSWLSRGRNISR
jgi:hypothetical protein